jgi:hypothetical protein
MNRDQSLALLNEYYYSRQQNAHTGDCAGHVQKIAEQILQAMVAADEIERMGLRIKTLECERDAWRESSDAYKADLVASDSTPEPEAYSHIDSLNNPAAWPDLHREREQLKERIRAAHNTEVRHD